MTLPFIDSRALRSGLSLRAAIDALEETFGADELPRAPQRQHLDVGTGDLLIMPAWGGRAMGVKLVTVNPSNSDRGLPFINGVYVLFDGETLMPRALFDGAALTGMRTAAVSGLATRYLARPDATRLVIFGAGTQARWHLDAMRAERNIEHVTVVSRSDESARRFVAEVIAGGGTAWLQDTVDDDGDFEISIRPPGDLASEIEPGAPSDVPFEIEVGAPEAVTEADIVCTCTTSRTPVFDGTLLRPGTHVNSVGAYKPDARELDSSAVARARLFVELREPALEEAGDVLLAIEEGAITADHIAADLRELVRKGSPARRNDEEITAFKSVGVAFEDLAVAAAHPAL